MVPHLAGWGTLIRNDKGPRSSVPLILLLTCGNCCTLGGGSKVCDWQSLGTGLQPARPCPLTSPRGPLAGGGPLSLPLGRPGVRQTSLPQSPGDAGGCSDCGMSPGVWEPPVGVNSLGPHGCVTDSVSPTAEWEHSLPGVPRVFWEALGATDMWYPHLRCSQCGHL